MDRKRYIGPVVEKPNPDAFLTEEPIDLMLTGKYNKVPIIIGYTSHEGMLLEVYAKFTKTEASYRINDFEKVIPLCYNIQPGTELSKTIAKKIEEFYFSVLTFEEDIDKHCIVRNIFWLC